MKNIHSLVVASLILAGCNSGNHSETPQVTQKKALPVIGTWQLISGTTIEKNDTTITYYTKELSFIKIINDTHFAFLKHDLSKGKDATASFGAGGGKYTLTDSVYTEQLEYCNDRQWEGNDFTFTVTIQNDTLVQSGIEKVESAGINRINIEKYAFISLPHRNPPLLPPSSPPLPSSPPPPLILILQYFPLIPPSLHLSTCLHPPSRPPLSTCSCSLPPCG